MKNGDEAKLRELFISIYNEDEDQIYDDELFSNRADLRLIANIVINTMPDSIRLCDMACGHGELLRILKQYGIECYGVDGAIQRVKYVMNMGILCNYANVENCGYPNDFFDAVSCNECLEHVRNPFAVMNEIRRILKKDGIALITVPFESACDCDGHVRQFSIMDLCMLAINSGFYDIKIIRVPYLNREKDNNVLLTGRKREIY